MGPNASARWRQDLSALARVCGSLAIVATIGVAVVSAVALGQAGGPEAQAALAVVSAVAGG